MTLPLMFSVVVLQVRQEAIRLGISRALCEINEEFRLALKPHGLLTRDARMVEKKEIRSEKARKRFQFSKR